MSESKNVLGMDQPQSQPEKWLWIGNLLPEVDTVPAEQELRWLILAVIGLTQLMVVLDAMVMNIALPSAQPALYVTTADRQWWSRPTRWRSAAYCCSGAGWRTCSAAR